jgi:hypothetical protein
MKKFRLILIILLLIVYFGTSAQSGLGDFKLNKTKIDYVISKYPTFIEITDSNDCQLVRKFHSDKYEILDVTLTNLNLIFYDDYLVDFKCDRDKLIEIYFASKYGRPKISRSFDTININNVKYENDKTVFMWENDHVKTISTFTRRFNDFFKVMVDSYFNIYDNNKIQKIKDCNGTRN